MTTTACIVIQFKNSFKNMKPMDFFIGKAVIGQNLIGANIHILIVILLHHLHHGSTLQEFQKA